MRVVVAALVCSCLACDVGDFDPVRLQLLLLQLLLLLLMRTPGRNEAALRRMFQVPVLVPVYVPGIQFWRLGSFLTNAKKSTFVILVIGFRKKTFRKTTHICFGHKIVTSIFALIFCNLWVWTNIAILENGHVFFFHHDSCFFFGG